MNLLHYAVIGVLTLEREASVGEIASILDVDRAEARAALHELMVRGHARGRIPIGDPSMYELVPKEER